MRDKVWFQVVAVGVILAIGLAASYALAKAGEPQSAWMWCNLAGVCS